MTDPKTVACDKLRKSVAEDSNELLDSKIEAVKQAMSAGLGERSMNQALLETLQDVRSGTSAWSPS